jgi:hypothetical protein
MLAGTGRMGVTSKGFRGVRSLHCLTDTRIAMLLLLLLLLPGWQQDRCN